MRRMGLVLNPFSCLSSCWKENDLWQIYVLCWTPTWLAVTSAWLKRFERLESHARLRKSNKADSHVRLKSHVRLESRKTEESRKIKESRKTEESRKIDELRKTEESRKIIYLSIVDKDYYVTVTTDDSWGAGTNDYVYIQLIGSGGTSKWCDVATGGGTDDFENDAYECLNFCTTLSPIFCLATLLPH